MTTSPLCKTYFKYDRLLSSPGGSKGFPLGSRGSRRSFDLSSGDTKPDLSVYAFLALVSFTKLSRTVSFKPSEI